MNVGAPKERPILFSGPMVKALLSGAKTQTRRLIKASGPWDVYEGRDMDPWPLRGPGQGARVPCPYGFPGDRLWVRETWALLTGAGIRVVYRADGEPRQRFYPDEAIPMKWAPSIHMPRKYSRLSLEVTGIRVERLHDISEADALSEGVTLKADSISWKVLCPDGRCYDTFVEPDTSDPEVHAYVRNRKASTWTARDAFRVLWMDINGVESWKSNPWVWVVSFERAEAAR